MRALAIREKDAPESFPMAATLNRLGNVAFDTGDLSAAEAYHRRALGIRARLVSGGSDETESLHEVGLV
jgi:hypothetical protein